MIPFFDYRPEHRRLEAELDAAVRRVIASGRLILGPEVESFEQEMADRLGVGHAVGVASGTDALVLALRAVGVGRGDEVLTVSNAGAPPIAAIRATGAKPRLIDVDDEHLLLDPAGLEAAHGPRTAAVLAVHLYGQPAPVESILAFTDRHGLPLIEDCAQATGATYQGHPVGSLGTIGCFSFYPTKNLGAYGDGGLCATDRPELAARLRLQRMYGFRAGERHAREEGLNSRLDEIQAALLRVKLERLDATLAERRRLAALYGDALAEARFRLPSTAPGCEHTYHLYVVRSADREPAIARLTASGIGYGIHYPEPVHTMDAYRRLGLAAGPLPISETACRTVLSLPLYPGLTDDDVRRIARTLAA